MSSRHARRRCAAIGVAATIAMSTAFAPAATSAAPTEEGVAERPCFIIQANWNTAHDGPQPTCPIPTWRLQD